MGSYAIVLVLEGRAMLELPDCPLTPLKPGDLLVVFPDLPDRYGAQAGCTWAQLYLVFDGPVFDLWREQGILNPKQRVLSLGDTPYWRDRIERIMAIPAWLGTEQAMLQVCQVQLLLAEALAAQRQSQLGSAQWAWLRQARQLLDQSTPNIDWPAAAREMGMQYEGFRRKFARLAGVSPGRYHATTLMNKARQLLQERRLSNKQVAAECGFCDEYHFSKRFKQLIGMNPSDFRKLRP